MGLKPHRPDFCSHKKGYCVTYQVGPLLTITIFHILLHCSKHKGQGRSYVEGLFAFSPKFFWLYENLRLRLKRRKLHCSKNQAFH